MAHKFKNLRVFTKNMIFELDEGQNDQGILFFEGNSQAEKENSKESSPIRNSKKKSFDIKLIKIIILLKRQIVLLII